MRAARRAPSPSASCRLVHASSAPAGHRQVAARAELIASRLDGAPRARRALPALRRGHHLLAPARHRRQVSATRGTALVAAAGDEPGAPLIASGSCAAPASSAASSPGEATRRSGRCGKLFEALARRGPLVVCSTTCTGPSRRLLDLLEHLVGCSTRRADPAVCLARPELLGRAARAGPRRRAYRARAVLGRGGAARCSTADWPAARARPTEREARPLVRTRRGQPALPRAARGDALGTPGAAAACLRRSRRCSRPARPPERAPSAPCSSGPRSRGGFPAAGGGRALAGKTSGARTRPPARARAQGARRAASPAGSRARTRSASGTC